jgi:O-antigen ligase
MDRIIARYAFFFAGPTGCLDRASLLARGSVLFLLAVLPFSHNAALKNIAIFGMLTAAIWLTLQHRLTVDWRSPIVLAVSTLLAVLGVTAALGTDPADSFSELRKHFLSGILLLVLVPQVFTGSRLTRLILSVIALAFMLRAGLTLLELGAYFPDLDTGRAEGNFIKGFSLDAGFYVPVLVGLMLLGGRWRWMATLGLFAVLVVMLLVQSRTPLLAAGLAVVVMLVMLRRWRVLLFSFVLVLFAGGYLAVSHPEIANRLSSMFDKKTYQTALDTENYTKAEGLAARMPIWFGVLEITANRSWQGYGFGWKKLGKTAVEDGHVARWQAISGDAFAEDQAWYFALPTSKVNPHNLYLQIYFESGCLGLAAYGLLLLVLFWQAGRLACQAANEQRIVAGLVLAFLVDHVIIGFSNGLWLGLGPSLALVALLETVRRSEKSV